MSDGNFVPMFRNVRPDILLTLPAQANFGLVYNKLPNQWRNNFLKFDKKCWLDDFLTKQTDTRRSFETSFLAESLARLEALAGAFAARTFELSTASRFVTGMGISHPVENGFSWHHTLGVPFIPGTTLKGLTRSWVEQWLSENEELSRLFGSDPSDAASDEKRPNQVGDLIFFDALPTSSPTLEIEYMAPHYSGYYQGDEPPTDWQSPTPIPFLAVAAGATFKFIVMSRSQDRGIVQKGVRWLVEALTMVGIGAKTSSGYGLFRPWNPANPPWEYPPEDEIWIDCRLERKHQRGMVSLLVTAPDGRQLTISNRIWQPEESRLESERFTALKEGRLRATITVESGAEPEFKEFNEFKVADD